MAEQPGLVGARPGVLSLSIKEKSALYAAYIPTTKVYHLGDEVFMLISLMDDPTKIPVAGKVVWYTPPAAQGNKTQGIGVRFNENESSIAARDKIEGLLGGSLNSSRLTHTM
jgi:type IV pilus assembly protein PilZ